MDQSDGFLIGLGGSIVLDAYLKTLPIAETLEGEPVKSPLAFIEHYHIELVSIYASIKLPFILFSYLHILPVKLYIVKRAYSYNVILI